MDLDPHLLGRILHHLVHSHGFLWVRDLPQFDECDEPHRGIRYLRRISKSITNNHGRWEVLPMPDIIADSRYVPDEKRKEDMGLEDEGSIDLYRPLDTDPSFQA